MSDHYYLQPFLNDGSCKKQKSDGTMCGASFTGPRTQKYCKECAKENDKARQQMSNKRSYSRRKAGKSGYYSAHPQAGGLR